MFDLNSYFDIITNTPILRGLTLVTLSIVAAKLVDMVFTFIFKRVVNKTKTTLDSS